MATMSFYSLLRVGDMSNAPLLISAILAYEKMNQICLKLP